MRAYVYACFRASVCVCVLIMLTCATNLDKLYGRLMCKTHVRRELVTAVPVFRFHRPITGEPLHYSVTQSLVKVERIAGCNGNCNAIVHY